MLEEAYAQQASASNYWQEELDGFEYMLDASPLIIEKLREHCYHITGLLSYSYRRHHAHKSRSLQQKLQALQAIDTSGLCTPESPKLGGFGYKINNGIYNIDTLKFYESLIALDKAGVLSVFRSDGRCRRLVVEIGSGWGGFAYQFKTVCQNVTYLCVDLPQTLLFAAVYLMSVFPDSKVLIYGDMDEDRLFERWEFYDFIFLPHYIFANLDMSKIDLGINMVSFQEMTMEQVSLYAEALVSNDCPAIYSHNRDHSPHNPELIMVSEVLSDYYDLTEIHVLDVAYTDLNVTKGGGTDQGSLVNRILRLFSGQKSGAAAGGQSRYMHEYRHLFGILR